MYCFFFFFNCLLISVMLVFICTADGAACLRTYNYYYYYYKRAKIIIIITRRPVYYIFVQCPIRINCTQLANYNRIIDVSVRPGACLQKEFPWQGSIIYSYIFITSKKTFLKFVCVNNFVRYVSERKFGTVLKQ